MPFMLRVDGQVPVKAWRNTGVTRARMSSIRFMVLIYHGNGVIVDLPDRGMTNLAGSGRLAT
jgi:hypothetical protein